MVIAFLREQLCVLERDEPANQQPNHLWPANDIAGGIPRVSRIVEWRLGTFLSLHCASSACYNSTMRLLLSSIILLLFGSLASATSYDMQELTQSFAQSFINTFFEIRRGTGQNTVYGNSTSAIEALFTEDFESYTGSVTSLTGGDVPVRCLLTIHLSTLIHSFID